MIGRLLFSGALLFISAMVQAEEVNDTSKVFDLDEIVVVSQPKDGRLLRHQPLSSTVLTQREMQTLGVSDLAQLSQYVPSFSMPQYGSRLTSSMYIRGIGSRINNPAVGIYYDNIPLMSKAAFNHHFYHIDRVDVLRGPQSTLYGMNTEGGLVHIYSKNPMMYQGTDIAMGPAWILQESGAGRVERQATGGWRKDAFHVPTDPTTDTGLDSRLPVDQTECVSLWSVRR